ncbi:hypothetical protein LINPERHAP1_LOCUS21402 [Linum perenne]
MQAALLIEKVHLVLVSLLVILLSLGSAKSKIVLHYLLLKQSILP